MKRDVYDKAKYHLRDPVFRDGVPESRAYVVGGMLFGWLAARGRLAPWLQEEVGTDAQRIVDGKLTGPQLWERLGGVMDRDTPRGDTVAFLDWLYFTKPSPYHKYVADELASDLPSLYHVQGSRRNQIAVLELLDALLEYWETDVRGA